MTIPRSRAYVRPRARCALVVAFVIFLTSGAAVRAAGPAQMDASTNISGALQSSSATDKDIRLEASGEPRYREALPAVGEGVQLDFLIKADKERVVRALNREDLTVTFNTS